MVSEVTVSGLDSGWSGVTGGTGLTGSTGTASFASSFDVGVVDTGFCSTSLGG